MPWIHKGFISAARSDFNKFIDVYRTLETDSYEDFEKVWFSLNFHRYHSFTGRRGRTIKCIEYIMNCFFGVLLEFCRSQDRIERVASVYLLYGLFYTQPLMNPIRIRLTLSDFDMLTIFASMNREINSCVTYCIWKLADDNCCDFVLHPFPYTPPYINVNKSRDTKKEKSDLSALLMKLEINFDTETFIDKMKSYQPLKQKLEPYLPELNDCSNLAHSDNPQESNCIEPTQNIRKIGGVRMRGGLRRLRHGQDKTGLLKMCPPVSNHSLPFEGGSESPDENSCLMIDESNNEETAELPVKIETSEENMFIDDNN